MELVVADATVVVRPAKGVVGAMVYGRGLWTVAIAIIGMGPSCSSHIGRVGAREGRLRYSVARTKAGRGWERMGDGIWATGDRRQAIGDRRRMGGVRMRELVNE